jgi:hypothetical protein
MLKSSGGPSTPTPTEAAATRSRPVNLGANARLLAAAALMIEYILNAAVGISAGGARWSRASPGANPDLSAQI